MKARRATLLLVTLAGCAIGPGAPRPWPTPGPRELTANAARGKPIYTQYCAPCHGDGGEGNGRLAREFDPPPTDLVASGVRVSVKNLEVTIQTPHYSTRVMTERITSGNREMPAWDEVLTQQEIDDVIAYVRTLIQAHAAAEERG